MRAIFVMIDGLRPDTFEAISLPHLEALRKRGASTMNARSVMPSITLPCHMSIFHSVPPTRHGVVTNDYQPMARPVQGLVDVAKGAGLRCSFIYNWEPLRNLNKPGTLSFSYFIDNCYTDPDADHVLTKQALLHQAEYAPDFMFLYYGTVDIAGHNFGWMSEGYLAQAARADAALGLLVAGLPSDVVLLIHADHGGHERTHGTEMPEDMTIPWIIAGPGIREGYEVVTPVTLLDTAPTLARVLGLQVDKDWEGKSIDEAFI